MRASAHLALGPAALWRALAACGPRAPSGDAAPPPATPPGVSSATAPSSAGAAPAPAKPPSDSSVASNPHARASLADLPGHAGIVQGFFPHHGLSYHPTPMTPDTTAAPPATRLIDSADSTALIKNGASHDLPPRVVFAAWHTSPSTLMGKAPVPDFASRPYGGPHPSHCPSAPNSGLSPSWSSLC
jgi:hypothetical protein